MATKKKVLGKVIGRVGSFNIRQIPSMKGGKVETSTIGVFAGKNKIKDGFRTSQEAADFVSNHTYNNKKKEFV